jgi:hypothetical protein
LSPQRLARCGVIKRKHLSLILDRVDHGFESGTDASSVRHCCDVPSVTSHGARIRCRATVSVSRAISECLRRGLQARLPSAPPQWPIISGRSVRTDDDLAARGMVSRRRSSQMATRRHNAGSKCEANSRLISKGRQ